MSLQMLCEWAFTTRSSGVEARELVIIKMRNEFPDLIDLNEIFEFCKTSGFARLVNELAGPAHDYESVIKTLAVSPERRRYLFRYIVDPTSDVLDGPSPSDDDIPPRKINPDAAEANPPDAITQSRSMLRASFQQPVHPPEPAVDASGRFSLARNSEMRTAVRNNFQLLVLADAKKAVSLIHQYDPQFHAKFLKGENQPFVIFLYLQAVNASPYVKTLTENEQFERFRLMCQYASSEVKQAIEDSQVIDLAQALPICQQYRVMDACIHIHTMLGDMQAAVNFIAEELEAVLVDAVTSGYPIRAVSLDLVKDEPQLKKPYETVVVAFDLLSKAPEIGTLLEKMWKKAFLAFQLPMWMCKNEIKDLDTQQSMKLFFAYFVVEALLRSNPETVFEVLRRYFYGIDPIQFRDVLTAVFKYLDYNEMLSQTVIQLLVKDCQDLYQRATSTKTRAALVFENLCTKCGSPITGAGGVGALIFDCGHCYHDNSACGEHLRFCPKCKQQLTDSTEKHGELGESARAKHMKLRALSRVEFGLRRNYGKDQDLSESGTNIFFLSDAPVEVRGLAKLTVPPDEAWPQQEMIFLEL
jgi:hypothetical protein